MKYFVMKNIKEKEVELCKADKSNVYKGCIGYITMDFNDEGKDSIGMFYSVNPLLNTSDFKNDYLAFVYYLQKSKDFPLLADKDSKEKLLALCDDMRPFEDKPGDYGFSAGNQKYKYYVRCPEDNEHDAIIYCYQKRTLLDLNIIEEDFFCEDDNKRI